MKQTKKIMQFLLLLVLVMSLVACSSSKNEQSKVDEQLATQQNTKFPVTVTDGANRIVTVNEEPKKIISLIPSNTEIAFALGLGDQIIAVTDNDTYPPEVDTKERIGGYEINLEKIIALEPDLVLANIYHKNGAVDVVAKLEELNINVLVVPDAQSFEETYSAIRLIGSVTGKVEEANDLIASMNTRFQAIVDKSSSILDQDKKRIWAEFSAPPEIFTAGKGTFMHEMIEVIGAVNAVGDHDGWIMFTEEEAVSLNPDVIIVNYSYIENAVELVKSRQGWAAVPAIANDQVYLIHEDLVSRPGPRLIDGLELLAKTVYPEIYK